MRIRKLTYILFLALVLLGGMQWHQVAGETAGQLWWLDNVLHFLGGLMVALIFLFTTEKRLAGFAMQSNSAFANAIIVVSFVGLVGIFWEFYEFGAFYFFYSFPMELGDTLSDLFFDLLGGFVGALLYVKSYSSTIL